MRPRSRTCIVQAVHSPSPGLSSRIDGNGQGGSQPTELCFHEIIIRSGCYKGRLPLDQESGTWPVQALYLAASQRNQHIGVVGNVSLCLMHVTCRNEQSFV